jgi:hypothetical protein
MVNSYLYQKNKKNEWNNFVKNSRTPLFFFQRDFMEYHSDRFTDHSLMFYLEDELVALLPANKNEETLISHGGLTYGGLICSPKIRADGTVAVIKHLLEVAKQQGFEKIIYKTIPYIFYQQPAQDDLYALFNVAGASLTRRDLSSIIDLQQRIGLSKGRKWLIARAKKNNLVISNSTDWKGFHILLSAILYKHGTKPIHSVDDLVLLHHFFPQNIELKVIFNEGQLLAATLLFKFAQVTHTQYMAVSEIGKELGALDYLINSCIDESVSQGAKYFSFGISTEQNGHFLNEGLLAQKESFGARTLCLDFYEVNLNAR